MTDRESPIAGRLGPGERLVRSPWDGSTVGVATESGAVEVEAALNAAARYFAAPTMGTEDRKLLLISVASALRDQAGKLAGLMAREIAKPVSFGLAELERAAVTFDLAAALLENPVDETPDLGPDRRAKRYRASVRRFPVGPILAIVPYNWPFNLTAHKLAPAIAAGCPVVLKPSPLAALSTLALAQIIHACGCRPECSAR